MVAPVLKPPVEQEQEVGQDNTQQQNGNSPTTLPWPGGTRAQRQDHLTTLGGNDSHLKLFTNRPMQDLIQEGGDLSSGLNGISLFHRRIDQNKSNSPFLSGNPFDTGIYHSEIMLGLGDPRLELGDFLKRLGVTEARAEGVFSKGNEAGYLSVLGNNGTTYSLLGRKEDLNFTISGSDNFLKLSNFLFGDKGSFSGANINWNGERFTLGPEIKIGNEQSIISATLRPQAPFDFGTSSTHERYTFRGANGGSAIFDTIAYPGGSLINVHIAPEGHRPIDFYVQTLPDNSGKIGIASSWISEHLSKNVTNGNFGAELFRRNGENGSSFNTLSGELTIDGILGEKLPFSLKGSLSTSWGNPELDQSNKPKLEAGLNFEFIPGGIRKK
jgi:hypothetical protein